MNLVMATPSRQSADYWSGEVERADAETLAEGQRSAFAALMARCAEVAHYRDSFAAAGVGFAETRLEDLRALPFMDKASLRELQPWGVMAVPVERVARIHATTGTTGLPCNVAFTRSDLDDIAELGARNLTAMGVGPGDVGWQCYGYGLWMGGASLDRAFETVGVTTFPAGPGRTTLAAQRLADLGVTVISCTPTFAFLLAERGVELGLDPVSDWRLRVGVFGGETMSLGARERLRSLLPPGFIAHNTYGTTELGGPFVAGSCAHGVHEGTFHVWADHFLVEVIDPDTGAEITEPGIVGELVITTLRREASPMVRWRTRDLTAWAPDAYACPCGRRGHPKLQWISGRSDDMVKVRGALVLPSQVEDVICSTPGTAASWQLVIDADPEGVRATEATVYVELASDGAVADTVAGELARRLSDRLGLRLPVIPLSPQQLPRYEGKARRVLGREEFHAAAPHLSTT